MSAPASEDLRELERELLLAAESGDSRSVADLRERFGLGHNDMVSALDLLREHGKAVESAPGEWRGPTLDEIDSLTPPAPVPRVVVEAPVDDERVITEAELMDGMRYAPPSPTVRLTMSIASALDANALGQLVKAGIEGLADGEPFVLEVVP